MRPGSTRARGPALHAAYPAHAAAPEGGRFTHVDIHGGFDVAGVARLERAKMSLEWFVGTIDSDGQWKWATWK